jgi:hypothetical protein
MFLLIKLILLPLKLIFELIEHSGHRRRYRRHHVRVNWTPGTARLTRWTKQVSRGLGAIDRTPVQRFVLTPLAVLAVLVVWLLLVEVWVAWWALLVLAVPIMLLA